MAASLNDIDPELLPHIFDHDKHLRALVGWLKHKKKNVHDLSQILGHGSTVAMAIWKLYDVEGWPTHARDYAAQQMCKSLEETDAKPSKTENH